MIETAEVASDEAEIGESSFGIDSSVTGEDRLVDCPTASVYSIEPVPAAIISNESVFNKLPTQTSHDNKLQLQSEESNSNTFVL